jgi:hypothetical protein
MTDDETPDHVPPTPAELFQQRAAKEAERDRGILTDRDRKYLWGQIDYETAAALSQCRRDIRQRAENGLLDLLYLSKLEEGEPDRIMQSLDENAVGGALRNSVASLIEFLYQNVDDPERWLESALVTGIKSAVQQPGRTGADVNIEIDVAPPMDLDELEDRLRSENSHTLTNEEIGALVNAGRLSADDLEQLHDPPSNPAMGDPQADQSG